MHLARLSIRNLRSIRQLDLDFEGNEAGWHVILGTNGAGKSSVIRAFALLAMGEREAYAARQDFSRWVMVGADKATISGTFTVDKRFDLPRRGSTKSDQPVQAELTLTRITEPGRAIFVEPRFSGERAPHTVWGGGNGWFASSFGPFRRFTRGDRIYDRLFVSNRRLAPHLTALGEDVALNETLSWLTTMHSQALQEESRPSTGQSWPRLLLGRVIGFINSSGFLPHGAGIQEVTNEAVLVRDGNGAVVPIEQLSDGYRSALCISVELLRQMHELFSLDKALELLHSGDLSNLLESDESLGEHHLSADFILDTVYRGGNVHLPGVVAIDEVDAHLHPTWQRDIGRWLTRSFPNVQFIVTTHSPIVCRAVADDEGRIKGSVWRLPAPGSTDEARRIDGPELDQLVFGDVLDAFGTELFGQDILRSDAGKAMVERLAELNAAALERDLTDEEKAERRRLRAALPAEAGALP